MRKAVLATTLAGVFLLGACSETSRRTANMTLTDTQLQSEIKRKLDAEPDLRAADLKVDANVERNEVTLSGTVTTEDQRARAVELAKSTKSGLVVTDKIDVKPT